MKILLPFILTFILFEILSAQVYDVGVTEIISPPDTSNILTNHPIILEVTNFGTEAASFSARFEAYFRDASFYYMLTTLQVLDLLPGEVDTITSAFTFYIFTETYYETYDNIFEYDIWAYTDLAGDENHSNDTSFMEMLFLNEFGVIVGNRNVEPVLANIGSIVEIPIWGYTPLDNEIDSVDYIHIPVSSDTNIIEYRYPGIEMDPGDTLPYHSYIPDNSALFTWDEAHFLHEYPDPNNSSNFSQSLRAFHYLYDPPPQQFITNGDTLTIGMYVWKTNYDPSLLGQIFYPFIEGYSIYNDSMLYRFDFGLAYIKPISTFGGIRFMDELELGHIAGHITDPSGTLLDNATIYAINAFRGDTTDADGVFRLEWMTPGIYDVEISLSDYSTIIISGVEIVVQETTIVNFRFSESCIYVAGDINNSGNLNGLDLVYLNYWIKGGPPPMECECPPFGSLYVTADVNGSCSFNYQDITYLLSYYRGGNAPIGCADCPPGG